jgi:hypothetical protein
MSAAELIFEEALHMVVNDDEVVIRNYRPSWLRNNKTGYCMEYDFYIPRFEIAFEIQGPHHYDDKDQMDCDELKMKLSDEHKVRLYQVSIFQLDPSVIRKKNGINTTFRHVGNTKNRIVVEQSGCFGPRKLKYSAFKTIMGVT